MNPDDRPWEAYGVRAGDDYVSIDFPKVYPDNAPELEGTKAGTPALGYIFVIEPARTRARYKLAGGHSKGLEDPFETALRELRGEANANAERRACHFVDAVRKLFTNPHWSCLVSIAVSLSEVREMERREAAEDRHQENEGERPKFFTPAEFTALVNSGQFLKPHFDRLIKGGLVRWTSK